MRRVLFLCGERAMGCGPCELPAGHDEDRRHLCQHYARNGVEFHDPNDPNCGCPHCKPEERNVWHNITVVSTSEILAGMKGFSA